MGWEWGRWVLVACWAAVILFFTSIPLPEMAGVETTHADKVGHFAMYLVLGALLNRAIGWELSRCRRLFIILITAILITGFGAADEWHQQFVNRNPAVADWLADVAGGAVGAVLAAVVWRRGPQEVADA